MRRTLAIIGLLLVPSLVRAQPLSPWVEEALRRADAGISTAGSVGLTNCEDETIITEMENNQTLVRAMLTNIRDTANESEYLRSRTACFQNDRSLLEDKLSEIRTKMNAAADACDVGGLKVLQDVYRFVGNAENALLLGGSDPTYANNSLRYSYPFDSPDAWRAALNPAFDSGSTAPLCPYTTDFSPHAVGYVSAGGFIGSAGGVRSYGCDKDALQMINGSAQQEAVNATEFIDQSTQFAQDVYVIIAAVFGGSGGPAGPPPHDKQSGCLRPASGVGASPDQTDRILAAFPDYFDPEHNSGGSYSPSAQDTFPEGMLLRPTYDFFLTRANPLMLEKQLIDQMTQFGRSRPLPEFYTKNSFNDSFSNMMTNGVNAPNQTRTIAANIEREMGLLNSIGRDPADRAQDSVLPLKSAMQTMIYVVSDFLPKHYIPDLNYFLLRSCVDGLCQKTVDTVIQHTFNPYCTPYLSGDYRNIKAHKYCMCDPSVQGDDPGFWKQYCESDYSDKQGEFDAKPPTLIPACRDADSPNGP